MRLTGVMDLECPACRALPGEDCTGRFGAPQSRLHDEREDALDALRASALDAGFPDPTRQPTHDTVTRIIDSLQRVRSLHSPTSTGTGQQCGHCHTVHPCATINAIEGVLPGHVAH